MTPRLPKPAPGLGARVLTAVALGVVMLAAILFGGMPGLGVLVGVIAALSVAEFYGLERRERRMPNEIFGIVAAAAMPLAAGTLAVPLGSRSILVTVLAAFVLAALLWHLAFRTVTAADTATTVFGALYVGFLLTHLVLLRALPGGMVLVLVTVVSVWANDVFAYFVGVAAGRHKMAPVISPHKSWEGFVGGAVCCVLVWLAAFSLSATPLGGTGLTLPWLAALGIAVALASLVGDLVESRFKREAVVKDSGVLLPGHGGFLDRFDSLIVVAPAVYYVVLVAEQGLR